MPRPAPVTTAERLVRRVRHGLPPVGLDELGTWNWECAIPSKLRNKLKKSCALRSGIHEGQQLGGGVPVADGHALVDGKGDDSRYVAGTGPGDEPREVDDALPAKASSTPSFVRMLFIASSEVSGALRKRTS